MDPFVDANAKGPLFHAKTNLLDVFYKKPKFETNNLNFS